MFPERSNSRGRAIQIGRPPGIERESVCACHSSFAANLRDVGNQSDYVAASQVNELAIRPGDNNLTEIQSTNLSVKLREIADHQE